MLGGCHNRLFLHPTPPTGPAPDQPGDIETVRSPSANCPEPRAFVLTLPGNAGSARDQLSHAHQMLGPLTESFSGVEDGRCGVIVFAMNYPGFGHSDGHATLRALGRAALDIYDALVEEADGRPIFVHGTSMGTTAALHISASRPEAAPAGLILERGPDIPGLVMGRFGWWNGWLLAAPVAAALPRSARSVPNARRIDAVPALFVLGLHDRLVRPPNGFRVYDAYRGPKRVRWLPVTHNAPILGGLGDGLSWLVAQSTDPAASPTSPPDEPVSPLVSSNEEDPSVASGVPVVVPHPSTDTIATRAVRLRATAGSPLERCGPTRDRAGLALRR